MGRLKRKLAAACDMPEGAFGVCPYIEIEGNSGVRICDCREMISYDEEKVVVAVTGMHVAVCGRELTIGSFGGGTVRLSGVVESVSLLCGEEKSGC